MPTIVCHRRQFLSGFATAAAGTLFPAAVGGKEPAEPKLSWYDTTAWGVEGKGWQDTLRYFDRLPARAEKLVRPAVWSLSRHSAGMLCRFETDATTIHARYELLSDRLALPHMPATGVSGLDLYVRGKQGQLRWVGVTRPTGKMVAAALATQLDPPARGLRQFTAYLPLYNGVETLEIGLPAGATFQPVAPRSEKPLVFYGTSIMHGACASRPGMAIPSIVGRRLDRPVINLGFSGNGRMEAEVGELLAELDPAAYLIDCLPNLQGDQIAARAEPLVRQLREARPQAPIVLVEDRTYSNAHIYARSRERHRLSRAALEKAYENLQRDGVENLYYLPGETLLGGDDESTTDGSHPSDLGMAQYADSYQGLLENILAR